MLTISGACPGGVSVAIKSAIAGHSQSGDVGVLSQHPVTCSALGGDIDPGPLNLIRGLATTEVVGRARQNSSSSQISPRVRFNFAMVANSIAINDRSQYMVSHLRKMLDGEKGYGSWVSQARKERALQIWRALSKPTYMASAKSSIRFLAVWWSQ